ncbi:MAG: SUF system NifU family Fe-S cluster assembly protein [Gammaproteobacteria bacterium]|nr:SUF system NifU family Fe-S cluster assembly protein [Gammaproteobacteria bacterium]MCH9764348.1 SUF system NifU family Fe-S cluster assembly protein [Gammaproteobacteria bacterium]
MNLAALYQEVILDHNRAPRNHHAMTCPTCEARGVNPLCGDKLTVYVLLSDGLIKEISFLGEGCAISQASASLMTEALKGKTPDEAMIVFKAFHMLLTEDNAEADSILGKLVIFEGVRAFPARVKCATLAWHALDAALKKEATVVTTE